MKKAASPLLINVRYCSHSRSASITSTLPVSTQYCVDLVRRCDLESYHCTLVMRRQRRAAFALRALNVELANAAGVQSAAAMSGRLHFWRRTIDDALRCRKEELSMQDAIRTLPAHPVAVELYLALQSTSKNLPRKWLLDLVDSREQRHRVRAFPDLPTLHAYHHRTVSTLLLLLLRLRGVEDAAADAVATGVGKAWGLVNVMRSMAMLAQQHGVIDLPLSIRSQHGIKERDVLQERYNDGMRHAVEEMCGVAGLALEEARKQSGISMEAKEVLLPAVICHRALQNISKVQFNPFHESLGKRDAFLPGRLLWNRFRGRF